MRVGRIIPDAGLSTFSTLHVAVPSPRCRPWEARKELRCLPALWRTSCALGGAIVPSTIHTSKSPHRSASRRAHRGEGARPLGLADTEAEHGEHVGIGNFRQQRLAATAQRREQARHVAGSREPLGQAHPLAARSHIRREHLFLVSHRRAETALRDFRPRRDVERHRRGEAVLHERLRPRPTRSLQPSRHWRCERFRPGDRRGLARLSDDLTRPGVLNRKFVAEELLGSPPEQARNDAWR